MAGDIVACSSCGGEYYEPTDPLPGVRPEKAPPPVPKPTALSSPPAMQPNPPNPLQPPNPMAPANPAAQAPPGQPAHGNASSLSDDDFDSMLQTLSGEAGLPSSTAAGATPPPGAPSGMPPGAPPGMPPHTATGMPPHAPPGMPPNASTGMPPSAPPGMPPNTATATPPGTASGLQPVDAAAAVPSPPAQPAASAEPTDMVAALESRGLRAILVSWPPARPYQANMAFSVDLTREGANDMLLKIAFQIIKQRWPELGSTLNDYENLVN